MNQLRPPFTSFPCVSSLSLSLSYDLFHLNLHQQHDNNPNYKPQVKLASVKYLDNLPSAGDPNLGTAFRDLEWEAKVLKLTQDLGIGAQFGGK